MNRISDEQFEQMVKRAEGRLQEAALKELKVVFENREEILRAFVAKYGFDPDECVQMEFQDKSGRRGWCVRKRKEGEP